MKYHTNEGKTYCVVGTVEGTVTSASGVVIASFSANEQNYFTAPAGGFVTISDETAIVTPVFDLAPSALVGKSSGGENTLQYSFVDNGKYTIEGDLSGCADGSFMFYNNTNLTSFSSDLPALTKGYCMFQNCSNLTSFEVDLPNLSDGRSLLYSCSSLTSFSSDLPNLTNGKWMFGFCSSLTSFEVDLPNLTDGEGMFYNCKNLRSFSSDLPKLTNGSQMFGSSTSNCSKLDLASVQNIANTINDLTAAGTTGEIHIGMASALQSDDETAPINVALAAIRAKGWTVNELYNPNN